MNSGSRTGQASHGTDGPADPRKRPSRAEDGRRAKRGRYTAVACNECKKKKLKCLPTEGLTCERCLHAGLACVFDARPPSQTTKSKHDRLMSLDSHRLRTLGEETALLRQQVADLAQAVQELQSPSPTRPRVHARLASILTPSPSNGYGGARTVPKDPQFVGPTRPAYGLLVAERSLTRMGIPASEPEPESPRASPTPSERSRGECADADVDFWNRCTPHELSRLLGVFEEEVESVYPFIDIVELASRADQILYLIRSPASMDNQHRETRPPLTSRDIEMAKLAAATGIAIEARGRNQLSAAIAESVQDSITRISRSEVALKGIQLLVALSIYHFHCDDELLAWRTIGIAARESLEMGLHRKKSLLDNFKDAQSRRDAMRVFWCVYVLDRRWSFGTSLSFALADRDIDPALPELDADHAYLNCMVGYARLCSQLWDAIPPLGAPVQSIPHETVRALDVSTQAWIEGIPAHLQMRHPHALVAARSQPRVLHRLRALLFLRGNFTRISIYQHYLLSAATMQANLASARLVVDVARDSVEVLVHLHATTDIYSRQQNAFNHFLLSAFAVIALAVCHAPDVFAEHCRGSFLDAVDLVRGFSRHSVASRRLWNSIRGFLPRLNRLGLPGSERPADVSRRGSAAPAADAAQLHPRSSSVAAEHAAGLEGGTLATPQPMGMPDMSEISSDLLDLFDTLVQGQDSEHEFPTELFGAVEGEASEGVGLSRRFLQGLM
ncbi:hypothetical protein RJ55_04770 [Drechmeria coniospora]|nr:hypothetical protein RJ55_04770 [Drechmeria coniospora]